jgi:hypothetical protein
VRDLEGFQVFGIELRGGEQRRQPFQRGSDGQCVEQVVTPRCWYDHTAGLQPHQGLGNKPLDGRPDRAAAHAHFRGQRHHTHRLPAVELSLDDRGPELLIGQFGQGLRSRNPLRKVSCHPIPAPDVWAYILHAAYVNEATPISRGK